MGPQLRGLVSAVISLRNAKITLCFNLAKNTLVSTPLPDTSPPYRAPGHIQFRSAYFGRYNRPR